MGLRIVAALLLMTSQAAEAQKAPTCEPKGVASSLLKDDLAGALKGAEDCVAFHLVNRGKPGEMLEETANANAGHWLLNRAAIKAMLGQKDAALSDLKAARNDAQENANGTTAGAIVQRLSLFTEAFIREKSGDFFGARGIYARLAAPQKPDLIEAVTKDAAKGRLALTELDSGKEEMARNIALSLPQSPTSRLVLGELALKAWIKPSAAQHFQAGLDAMAKQESGNNMPLMIHFADHKRLAEGLAAARKP